MVILDEVQRLPGIFSILRGVIDQRRRLGEGGGQFLLLINAAPSAQASFYRSSNGAEVDLVLAFRSGQVWAIEIKRSSAPKVSKS